MVFVAGVTVTRKNESMSSAFGEAIFFGLRLQKKKKVAVDLKERKSCRGAGSLEGTSHTERRTSLRLGWPAVARRWV